MLINKLIDCGRGRPEKAIWLLSIVDGGTLSIIGAKLFGEFVTFV